MSAEELARETSAALNLFAAKRNYDMRDVIRGTNVEFEHGEHSPQIASQNLDVIKGDRQAATKIALAHLEERGDYYDGLDVLEEAPINFWRGKNAESFLFSVGAMRATLALVIIVILIALFFGFDSQKIIIVCCIFALFSETIYERVIIYRRY